MNKRETRWQVLQEPFDVVVIGGGITGAGIFYELAFQGYRTVLLEQADFAWGTSSRSSKLVHGGLRYLRQGKLCLTHEALQEREWLLRKSHGLVTPLQLLLPIYQHQSPGYWGLQVGLTLYDLLAKDWHHGYHSLTSFLEHLPYLERQQLKGGFWFKDAQTDDARLTFRLIQDGEAEGGIAQNYAKVCQVEKRGSKGDWQGVVQDRVSGLEHRFSAKVLVNATGVWSDQLPGQWEHDKWPLPSLRPLRGSHIIFPAHRLPVAEGVMLFHPRDGRPVFVLPWEGVTIVGTTDLDHDQDLAQEPAITPSEVTYLFEALEKAFPRLALTPSDVLSAYSGVRPIISSGRKKPSSESRASWIIYKNGAVTVTGGKLTTFRSMASKVVSLVNKHLPSKKLTQPSEVSWFVPGVMEISPHFEDTVANRVMARYGARSQEWLSSVLKEECQTIAQTYTLWAELRWAALHESVVHLDDLLLRRTRIGLLLPKGGQDIFPRIRELCQSTLGWDDKKWEEEEKRYGEIWKRYYSLS